MPLPTPEESTHRIQGTLLFFFFGLCIGTMASFAGMGGGFLIVPLLLGCGFSSGRAVGTSLSCVLLLTTSSLVAAISEGTIDPVFGLLIGIGGALGAQIGSRLVHHVPTRIFRKIFSFVLLALALFLVADSKFGLRELGITHFSQNPVHMSHLSIVGLGFLVGIVASFVGLGGGFLLTPILIGLGFSSERATGTAFIAILVIALSSVVVHLRKKVKIAFHTALFLGLGGITGAQIGNRLLPFVPQEGFKIFFALVLASLSLFIFRQHENDNHERSTG
ncbi:sulfite exporter TauE/SafE family protein [Desulfovibrio inopinatus]|uniref:sulfite exporter TauE/SafE family protein n=1 Tax=Desulfovibrio inopinatus TaxID=102109 RepID=UPI0004106863|nr:sulfite exporter TauE/SafE family protein [Desulfovibrio inopinatus]